MSEFLTPRDYRFAYVFLASGGAVLLALAVVTLNAVVLLLALAALAVAGLARWATT